MEGIRTDASVGFALAKHCSDTEVSNLDLGSLEEDVGRLEILRAEGGRAR